ncbi:fimbrillin family protein [Bacteroides timonensis]|uniref:fimbrillin family protein n=1 Tax=Bacteroides timonensis TaxID=1470345 RepID=UPI0005C6294D|nr:fimbrillin family protein [Bacteroides timonensis]
MKAKYLMIATVATLLAACSNDENEMNNGPVEARVTAGMGVETRAVNDNPSSFAANDAIGVIVTKVEQIVEGGTSGAATSGMVARYKNVKYTTEQGGSPATFAAGTGAGIFFQDATETVTFAAYYPYQTTTNAGTLPGTDGSGIIAVDTKDNNKVTANENKQAKIDFLFASGATASKSSPTVEFKDNSSTTNGTNCQFQHKMAQLKLVIVGSTQDGFTEEEAKKVCDGNSTYKLGGLKHTGTFTLAVVDGTATGTAKVSDDAQAVTDWTITGCARTYDVDNYKCTYTLILLPQDCSGSGSALAFKATIGGQEYTNNSSIAPNLEAGKTYTYTITVKKTGLTVSGCTIGAWTTTTDQTGDATM